ncbi:hypothetical protein GCM10009530_56810 [Microbispora corallina]|uniref:Integrase n=1 Tax=Microbispora corallina TaxID=83302 RepID=A0ABQ4G8V5_9ACTN|nr:hypothetical protein Mco01_64970 [Microbispora corallina]
MSPAGNLDTVRRRRLTRTGPRAAGIDKKPIEGHTSSDFVTTSLGVVPEDINQRHSLRP